MGLQVCVSGVFGEFQFPDVMQPYAGNFVCEWSPSRFLDDHVDIRGRACCHMHDRMYPFELGVVPFNIILKRPSFGRDP